jgi:hypothetical protein
MANETAAPIRATIRKERINFTLMSSTNLGGLFVKFQEAFLTTGNGEVEDGAGLPSTVRGSINSSRVPSGSKIFNCRR